MKQNFLRIPKVSQPSENCKTMGGVSAVYSKWLFAWAGASEDDMFKYIDLRTRFSHHASSKVNERLVMDQQAFNDSDESNQQAVIYIIYFQQKPVYLGQTTDTKRLLHDLFIGDSHHFPNKFPVETWSHIRIVRWKRIVGNIVFNKLAAYAGQILVDSQMTMKGHGQKNKKRKTGNGFDQSVTPANVLQAISKCLEYHLIMTLKPRCNWFQRTPSGMKETKPIEPDLHKEMTKPANSFALMAFYELYSFVEWALVSNPAESQSAGNIVVDIPSIFCEWKEMEPKSLDVIM